MHEPPSQISMPGHSLSASHNFCIWVGAVIFVGLIGWPELLVHPKRKKTTSERKIAENSFFAKFSPVAKHKPKVIFKLSILCSRARGEI